jgi:ATP-dependent Lon protease
MNIIKELVNTYTISQSQNMDNETKYKTYQQSRDMNLDSDSDHDTNIDYNSENDTFDIMKYRQLLQELYPSKYQNEKVKDGELLQKYMNMMKKSNTSDEDKQNKSKQKKTTKSPKKKSNTSQTKETKSEQKKSTKSKGKHDYEYESDGTDGDVDDDEIMDSDSEFDDSDLDESEIEELLKNAPKFNITFTIDDRLEENSDEEYTSDEDDEDDEDYNTDDMDDEGIEEEDNDEEIEEIKPKIRTRSYYKKSKSSKSNEHASNRTNTDSEKKSMDYDSDTHKALHDLVTTFKSKKKNAPKELFNKFESYMKKEEQKYKKQKEKEEKKEKTKNSKTFRKLLKSKNMMDDVTYFKKMELEKQKQILEETKQIVNIEKNDTPYRIRLIQSTIPSQYKANAMRKINSIKHMDPGSGEYYKIKHWVDSFMRIPFGVYRTLPIHISDGIEKCSEFIEKSKKTLDEAVYGMNDAKTQIMQLVGQWITNPDAVGTAIAIKGPMGTGKTSIIKEGISKILNRPFAFIALGGATDSSFLEGHSYTYEGSVWGKIVDIVMQSGCMNPVIYFDELDKVSGTTKGDEIIGILTHLTDTTQNTQYHDKYFADIDFDLSKCLFIFSYNDESKVNPILRDRMYRIETKGYSTEEKITIVRDYLIPSIEKNVNFESEMITITDEALKHIISHYTEGEKGVRNLKRCVEVIYTKLNLYRLTKNTDSLFDKSTKLKVEFPFIVDEKVVSKLIKKTNNNSAPQHMYI